MRKKKKIGILTYHFAHNYGAMLQAYALYRAVQDLGYYSELIDYRFPHIWRRVVDNGFFELCKTKGVIKGLLTYIKRLITGRCNPRLSINLFNKFRNHVMRCSKKTYYSPEQLNNMDYDVILFGSDQIWNSKLTNGIAIEFVGGFDCLEKTKKIAYGASCGKNAFSIAEKESYYPLLKDFYKIGVRETAFGQTLNEDGICATTVLDPSFLLHKEEWVRMYEKYSCVELPEKKYLLLHMFDEDEKIYTYIDKIAKEKNLEVVVIAYKNREVFKNYTVFTECGPADFVKLFDNAQIIVSTSFHATAFSIILEKDFYCIPHPTLHERTDSLLDLVGLNERNIKDISMFKVLSEIDWTKVSEKLDYHREIS